MTRRVCASMPSGSGALSSAGSVGIWPVTKSQPSAAVAWLNGATGVGAFATIRNSIMPVSPQPEAAAGRECHVVNRSGRTRSGDPLSLRALTRHPRACPGDPRLLSAEAEHFLVDGRAKPGHDEWE